ncbi:MAG TPA: amino acid adenylation domain-containing protein, partial [Blastocatellia bacterium]
MNRNIEDIYPLTSLQEGMLFHSLSSSGSAIYFEQVIVGGTGELDSRALRSSWEHLLQRHSILRTSFAWEHVSQPLQIVRKTCSLPWTEIDWRDKEPEAAQQLFKCYLEDDRRRGFDFSKAPLLRVTLVRLPGAGYRIVFSHHHILLDAWSISILLSEMSFVYEACRQGLDAGLQPAPPFKEFIGWLQTWNPRAAESYWRQALAGLSAPVSIQPSGDSHADGRDGEWNWGEQQIVIDLETTNRLRSLSRAQGITMATLFVAAWGIVVARCTGANDIVFGMTLSGRPHSLNGVERMAGLFTNTLPLRLPMAAEHTLLSWLRMAGKRLDELYEFVYTPLTDIHQWSEVPAATPLFDSIVAFDSTYARSDEGPGATNFRRAIRPGQFATLERSHYHLAVNGFAGRRFAIKITYNLASYSTTFIERILGYAKSVMENMADYSIWGPWDIPILSSTERHQMVREWNDTSKDFGDRCVHELFEEQVERRPDAVAVIFEDEILSYEEVNGRANELAHSLRLRGMGPGGFIGICVERSAGMIAGILGILKAGTGYVPLDPELPEERLKYQCEDSSLAVVLTDKATEGRFGLGVPAINLDRVCARASTVQHTNPVSGVGPENWIYVIYTSGSTGEPKGVLVHHRGVANYVVWLRDQWRMDGEDRGIAKASLSFDASAHEIFPPLIAGGSVIVAPPGGHQDIKVLSRLIGEYRATTFFIVPSMLQLLLSERGFGSFTSSLKRIACGAETMPPVMIRDFYSQSRAELHNVYGPTEATIICSDWVCGFEQEGAVVPIGRPVSNSSAYILAKGFEIGPAEAPGELCIGGLGLTGGYLNRPEISAEKFIPNGYGTERGDRLYRTGDLARFRGDGNIEYLGRIDHQVKIRGYRIELGEIESVLSRYPGVKQCVVVTDGEGQAKMLVAYYVARAQLSRVELREFLSKSLPEYMVPSEFVRLDEMPVVIAGKIDRRGLPAVHRVSEGGEAGGSAISGNEEFMSSLWAEVLDRETIGVEENFFELGGHSLLAMRLISRVRDVFRADIPLRELFEAPTVREFTRALERFIAGNEGWQMPPAITRSAGDGDWPMSFAQQRMWFLQKLAPGLPFYNVPFAFTLRGGLSLQTIEQALKEIARRQEALRTTFHMGGGALVQAVSENVVLGLDLVDLTGLEKRVSDVIAQSLACEEGERTFDLGNAVPVRTRILMEARGCELLLVTFHHISFDAWSNSVFLGELGALYRRFAVGGPSELDELGIQYKDYSAWQRQWLTGDTLESDLAYWRKELNDPPCSSFPTDRARPAVETFDGSTYSFAIGKREGSELGSMCRNLRVTPFMALLTVCGELLSRYSGTDETVFGTACSNRSLQETERVIGLFINTLALRLDFSGAVTYIEAAERVRDVVLAGYAHQNAPFEKIIEELQPDRDLSRGPLFQTFFTVTQTPGKVSNDLLSSHPTTIQTQTSRFDMTLVLEVSRDGIGGLIEYNTDLYDSQTIARLANQFRILLGGALGAPDCMLSQIPILSSTERHQLVREWNDTAWDQPDHLGVIDLLQTRAALSQDAVAVTSGKKHLSYGRLDSDTDQIAEYLNSMGVGPDDAVAICAQRSCEAVMGIIGILKSGGTFLPLDPSYPKARLELILEDSSAKVLLTQQEVLPGIPDTRAAVILIENAVDSSIARTAATRVQPSNPAYVIYTSGSTGTPKGVVVTHGNLLNLFAAMDKRLPCLDGDVWVAASSISFDISILELLWTLSRGFRVAIPQKSGAAMLDSRSNTDRSTPDIAVDDSETEALSLPDLLRIERPSHLQCAPSTAEILLGNRSSAESLSCLKALLLAGEPFLPSLAERLSNHTHASLFNLYGPTETTMYSSMYRLAGGDARVPIGRPIANTGTFILNRMFHPVPIATPGELYITGQGVARGYLGKPYQTAERFLPDPFASRPGSRFYRTGDLVRALPDGNLDFMGRIDYQVKVRGLRIELQEVEAALLKNPYIRQAVAVAHRVDGDARLAAYVVLQGETTEDINATVIRSLLSETLPGYMIPSYFLFLDELPLTPNMKVDRKALPPPDGGNTLRRRQYIPPQDDIEEVLVQMWESLLKVSPVSVTDSFFESGGHSLLAVQLMGQIQAHFGKEFPLATLFENGTVERLARILRKGFTAPPNSPLAPMKPGGSRRPLFFVHVGSGNVLAYVDLVRHLHVDQPFYGIEDPNLHSDEAPALSIEEMASAYIELIRQVQPAGPYSLGGWSFGGIVAYEMAQQLSRMGEEVSH